MSRFLFSRKAPRARISGPVLSHDEREFYENLGADADVVLEPGYNQDEIFDDQFERRAREKTRTPSANNAVNIIPAMRGPWTGNNNLGIQRKFAPDENNRQTILKLPEWGFPDMWTLCLGLDFDASLWIPSGLASASFDITALIEFGIGGVIQECEIDWVNGACIALPFNAINVVAQYNLQVGSEFSGPSEPPLDLVLRASIAKGVLTQTEPTRTFRADGSTTIDLPPFARKMKVIASSPNPGDAFAYYSSNDPVVFRTGTSISIGFEATRYEPCQLVEYLSVAESTFGRPVWVDVPTGARSVSITSSVSLLAQFLIGA